jgi:hypothetical protein
MVTFLVPAICIFAGAAQGVSAQAPNSEPATPVDQGTGRIQLEWLDPLTLLPAVIRTPPTPKIRVGAPGWPDAKLEYRVMLNQTRRINNSGLPEAMLESLPLGESTIEIWGIDMDGQESDRLTWTFTHEMNTSPTLKMTLPELPVAWNQRSGLEIKLKIRDRESGIDEIHYRINSEAWLTRSHDELLREAEEQRIRNLKNLEKKKAEYLAIYTEEHWNVRDVMQEIRVAQKPAREDRTLLPLSFNEPGTHRVEIYAVDEDGLKSSNVSGQVRILPSTGAGASTGYALGKPIVRKVRLSGLDYVEMNELMRFCREYIPASTIHFDRHQGKLVIQDYIHKIEVSSTWPEIMIDERQHMVDRKILVRGNKAYIPVESTQKIIRAMGKIVDFR